MTKPRPDISKAHERRIRIADSVRRILLDLGVRGEPADDLGHTPMRVSRALEEMTSGYGKEPKMTLFGVEGDEDHGLVVSGPIEFSSMCSHHLLPFYGEAFVGYVPRALLIGASKIPRLVHHYSKRLQLQERLSKQVAERLYDLLEHPKAVLVYTRATHACMSCRGARSRAKMGVTVMRPASLVQDNQIVVNEFYKMIGTLDD